MSKMPKTSYLVLRNSEDIMEYIDSIYRRKPTMISVNSGVIPGEEDYDIVITEFEPDRSGATKTRYIHLNVDLMVPDACTGLVMSQTDTILIPCKRRLVRLFRNKIREMVNFLGEKYHYNR